MQLLKKILLSVYQKPSQYLFVFLIIFSVDRYNRWVDFDNGKAPFIYDVDQYYSYLPAAFIHNDLSFSFPSDYWTTSLPNGNHIPKVTFGMSVLYSPFFFIGHLIAKLNGDPTDGYSLPYKWSIHFGSILYSLIGLWYCRKNLLFFYSELVTAVTLICIYLGTNLFYYTYGTGEMPHSYLFCLFSLFIFFTLKWHQTKKLKYLLIFSFLAGLATLIRPTESVILLFPILLGVQNFKGMKEKIQSFLSYRYKLIWGIILFFIPFFFQMIYWKIYAGQWLFFSYGSQEGFFFNDPKILNFLISFRKGWLIYTPIMLFALIGMFFLKRKNSGLFYFTILYFAVNIYILSSWWDWSFGGSFGCRALIQHYAFFALPFGAFVSRFFDLFKDKKIINFVFKGSLCIVFYLLIAFNMHQSWQYKYSIIAPDGMTKEAYFYILERKDLSEKDMEKIGKMVKPVSREDMLNGKRN